MMTKKLFDVLQKIMSNINVNLKEGDVLLFAGKKTWRACLIKWLTKSKIYHAALYIGQNKIIEASPPLARIYNLDRNDRRFRKQRIYINRFNNEELPKQPIINVAQNYINLLTPFAEANLLFLALILLYKKLEPDDILTKELIKFFQHLTTHLLDWIYNQPHIGGYPKFCSQLVFESYENAGSQYRLRKRRNLTSEAIFINQVIEYTRGKNFPINLPNQNNVNLLVKNLPSDITQFEEKIAQSLYKKFLSISPANTTKKPSEELIVAVLKFGEAIYLLEESLGNVSLIQESEELAIREQIPRGLALLKIKEQYFFTPEDLFNNCENLIKIGNIRC